MRLTDLGKGVPDDLAAAAKQFEEAGGVIEAPGIRSWRYLVSQLLELVFSLKLGPTEALRLTLFIGYLRGRDDARKEQAETDTHG